MREREPTEWVVYKVGVERQPGGHHAVCSQQEWDALEKSSSGIHTLIRAHIRHEGEAEQYARALQTAPPVPKVIRPTALALKKAAALEAARIASKTAADNVAVLSADDMPAGEIPVEHLLSPELLVTELLNPDSLETAGAIPEAPTELPS